jgi:hypothetical protein
MERNLLYLNNIFFKYFLLYWQIFLSQHRKIIMKKQIEKYANANNKACNNA